MTVKDLQEGLSAGVVVQHYLHKQVLHGGVIRRKIHLRPNHIEEQWLYSELPPDVGATAELSHPA